MSAGAILWQPTAERKRRCQMCELMREISNRYGIAPQYQDLHRWSVENRADFWQELLGYAGIQCTRDADSAYSGEGMLDTRWFPGMELNFAAHLLRHDDDNTAITADNELGRSRRLSYRELRASVAQCADALRRAGVRKGDRVAGFVPNIPESVIAMLATSSLGAIWSSCSPDFGTAGIMDRFGQIAPRILFTADAYSYNGKIFDCLRRVAEVVEGISAIEKVIVVGFIEERPDIAQIPHAELWSDFVEKPSAGTVELAFESLPFDHPLFIMYSSGTTGIPKCIVHGAGGTLLQHMKELMLHCDLRREDVIFYFTTCGWMMWNWVVSSLGVGATLVLYEGSPAHPGLNRLWQMADQTGITVFGTSPKFLSTCQKRGLKPGSEQDLSRLRCILSTGAPLTVENFKWVYSAVKEDLQLSSISGGTDIISCFMLGNPMLPVRAGEIQCLGLGMDVHAYDPDGKSLINKKGELVCTSPFPSQPIGFWNDPERRKYREAYFDHYPDVWRHGDFIEITEQGGVIVYGRSDATLNPGGIRIGTAEIYRIVESIDKVIDSLVVGKTANGEVEVCLFVVLREGASLDQALIDEIRRRIATEATKRHVPSHIHQVTAVPYTISGKKVELAVRQILEGEEVLNRDALANPDALEQYRGII